MSLENDILESYFFYLEVTQAINSGSSESQMLLIILSNMKLEM